MIVMGSNAMRVLDKIGISLSLSPFRVTRDKHVGHPMVDLCVNCDVKALMVGRQVPLM